MTAEADYATLLATVTALQATARTVHDEDAASKILAGLLPRTGEEELRDGWVSIVLAVTAESRLTSGSAGPQNFTDRWAGESDDHWMSRALGVAASNVEQECLNLAVADRRAPGPAPGSRRALALIPAGGGS